MKFINLLDKLNEAKILKCKTDFSLNKAYENDKEFILFTKEKIELRNYAKKLYKQQDKGTIRFYLYDIVSIALRLEGYYKSFAMFWDYSRYDFEDELSKFLINKVREIYHKYLPLYHHLIDFIINQSCYKNMFDKTLINNATKICINDFFILGNTEHQLTFLIKVDDNIKNYLINVIKDEETFGRTYIYYALYKNEELDNPDNFIYACTPHEDCIDEEEYKEYYSN